MGLSADTLKVGKQAVRQGYLTIRLRGSAKLALLLLKPYQLPAQLDKRLAGEICPSVAAGFLEVRLRLQRHSTEIVCLFLHGINAQAVQNIFHLLPVGRQPPKVIL